MSTMLQRKMDGVTVNSADELSILLSLALFYGTKIKIDAGIFEMH